MSIWNIISCSFYLWVVQQGVLNDFIHFAVDIVLSLHPIKVFCPGEDTSGAKESFMCMGSGSILSFDFQVILNFFLTSEVRNWLHILILSQVFSISFLCFKYMGQTWPSNRPAGSGTVYVLALQKHNRSSHMIAFQYYLSVICVISVIAKELLSPPFALLIRKGNVETFVINVNKRPAEGNQGSD